MIAWLIDTLVMTGAIMAFVLVVRKPVGRWFGPGAAYALWSLPMIRLVLPPLVLPESVAMMRVAGPFAPASEQALPATIVLEPAVGQAVDSGATMAWDIPWGAILVAIWLGGAAVFLTHRVLAYRSMRRELLRDANVVGRSGAVRIIESRAVAAPVAFGVVDRVVALPDRFLATADCDASDFAITHELEHHAGNDLLANMAVQPLFALHWFNPLAWLAWRALRSDQEAACDARVMAGRSRCERERYGRLIASFAAGSRFALAAPMAGPLKGDKPIVHRLRALVRNDVPEKHRIVGRSLFALCVVSVPLTASVTYAAVDAPEEAPPAGEQAVSADETRPGVATKAPAALRPPQATLASPAVHANPVRRVTIRKDLDESCPDAEATAETHVTTRDGTAFRILSPEPLDEAEIERTVERALAQAETAQAQAERALRNAERAHVRARRAARDAEGRAREALARAPRVEESISLHGMRRTMRIVSPPLPGRPGLTRTMVMDATCPADRRAVVRASADGTVAETRICTGEPDARRHVAAALRSARASIAANARIPAAARSAALSEIDAGIAEARAR